MPLRSSVLASAAIVGIGALTASPITPSTDHRPPPTVSREVALTAATAPPLGAIPLAFLGNQLHYCSLICPFAVQGAITVPLGALEAPAAFLGSLTSTGSPLQALGAAAASVTGPANAAVTPLINNDVFLVVPKAFHALDVAVVEAFNVGAAVLTPGQLLQAIQNGRSNILNALNQPVGTPTTPTGATNVFQVVSVEALNVATAVAFQAGELVLSGAVQIADATTQQLAKTGNPVAALAAGVAQAREVAATAAAPVVAAVDTAAKNISNSLHDPFPAATKTTGTAVQPKSTVATDQPKAVAATADTTKFAAGVTKTSATGPAPKVTGAAGTTKPDKTATSSASPKTVTHHDKPGKAHPARHQQSHSRGRH
ncbi:hypothetical protein ACGFK1_25885 [Mycobacterium sp. NPDC048908]|uniref:hypothetical protein n=1 Tax=Mycobacterium sp. NPDC048908 TaxID=3364292 RepID=UPI00371B79F7